MTPRRTSGPGGKRPGAAADANWKVLAMSIDNRTVSDPARELAAWAAAVRHLHALGLPAAAPEFAVAWLARRGIRADWATPA